MKNKIAVIGLSVCVVLPTFAESPKPPPIIQGAVSSNRYVIENHFEAAPGIQGWALRSKAGPGKILYSLADGKVIAGEIYGIDGSNLTTQHESRYLPPLTEEGQQGALSSLPSITEGKGAAQLYVFFDPHCGYCKNLWGMLRGAEEKITIHWIPVSFIDESGARILASVMSNERPAQALAQAIQGTLTLDPRPVSQKFLSQLDQNLAAMRHFGFTGTPSGVMYFPNGQSLPFTSIDELVSSL